MKPYVIAAMAIILLVTCSADAEERDNDEGLTAQKVSNLVSQIFRFRKLLKDKINDGTIDKESFRKPLRAAFENSIECFKTEIIKFNGTLMDLLAAFQKVISKSAEGEIEPNDGVVFGSAETPWDPLATMKRPYSIFTRLGQLVMNYLAALRSPEIQDEIKNVFSKVGRAAIASKDCFIKFLDSHLTEEQTTLLKTLWEESKITNQDNNAA